LFFVRRCRIWIVRRNLVVATDNRVELALPRAFGKVDRVFRKRLALPLRLLRIDVGAAANGVDRGVERLASQPLFLEQPARRSLVVGERQQEELAGDELVAALRRFLVSQVEQVVQVAGDRDLAAGALDLGQVADLGLQRRLHTRSR
jgi:hypothetical protein